MNLKLNFKLSYSVHSLETAITYPWQRGERG